MGLETRNGLKGQGEEHAKGLINSSLEKFEKAKAIAALEIKETLLSEYGKLNPALFDLYTYTNCSSETLQKLNWGEDSRIYDKIEGGLLVSLGTNWENGSAPGIVIANDGIFKFQESRYNGDRKIACYGKISYIEERVWKKREEFTVGDYLKYGKECAVAIDKKREEQQKATEK